MGCCTSAHSDFFSKSETALRAAILIQRWYRRYMARLEMRRRCTWRIFQSIEYSGEQDHLKLHNFFDYLLEHFTGSSSKEREFISRVFSESENIVVEKFTNYEGVKVPASYMGPRLSFPLSPEHATILLESFKQEQKLHPHYVLKLFNATRKHLTQLPNITVLSTCLNEEITICGDLHGQLNDLLLIFHKNGLPSPEKKYVFNGDFVDRGKKSVEILIILFTFLLLYPKDVHLNRGNHEDYMLNMRYGFVKEVMRKYREHGNQMLRLLREIFSCLPLATLIDQKVLIVHGGISQTTDLDLLAKLERRKFGSMMLPKRKTDKILDPAETTTAKPSSTGFCSTSSFFTQWEFARRMQHSIQEELDAFGRRTKLSEPKSSDAFSTTACASVSDLDARSYESIDLEENEMKQVVDILWSDPVTQQGCRVNEERGAGCYFGPDVTEMFLRKHNLQFIIRSHECKLDGYELCHDRKVITIFSASNYYTMGSNRGAYLKLGPDLVPHFVQYQAGKMAPRLSMSQRVSRVEEAAFQALRERLFAHRTDLNSAFRKLDKKETGLLTLNDWASAVESVIHLGLPWRMLKLHLVSHTVSGKMEYRLWLADLAKDQKSGYQKRIQSGLLETIYQNRSNLETIFNIIDSDHSGFISLEEFRQTWKLFCSHMNIEVSDQTITDLVNCIDFNKDGNIDFNEFLEAFRLVKQPQAVNELDKS